MSNIQDMHVEIDLELNKINSNFYDIILPEEKDYFLNKAQERFVKQRYGAHSNAKGTGFEMSEKRIDDLRKLLVPNYFDKAFAVDIADFDFTRKVTFFLPNDYWFLTSQRSKIVYSGCNTLVMTEVPYTFRYSLVNFNFPGATTNQFKIRSGATILIENLNYDVVDINIFLQDLMLRWNPVLAVTHGWKFYLDYYQDINNPGGIVAINLVDPPMSSLEYTLNGETWVPFVPTDKIRSYFNATGTEDVTPNKFAQQDDVYAMMLDPFNDTNAYGPLAIIHDNNIDVFFNNKQFVVKELAISYIRKPKLMSFRLNQSCELADHTHAEIVRDAVNLMLEDLEADKRLQTSVQVEQTNE